MGVLINKDSGLAENMPDSDAQSALQAGTHEIPLISPDGESGSAAYSDVPDLMKQGFKQPSTEQLSQLLSTAAHSTPLEQAKAGAEGAASALTFGASTAAETLAGVKPEDINARREANPGTHAAGEMAGLGLGMLTGSGELAMAEGAAKALTSGIRTTSTLGRVGGTAAKLAVENALIASGDEASRNFASDPTQSSETALANVGLSAALGGAFGGALAGASELWAAKQGKELSGFLNSLKNRASGVPEELTDSAGITLEPEMAGALNGTPEAQKAFQVLQESNSSSGTKAQQAYERFNEDIKKAVSSALGKTDEEVSQLHEASDFNTGNSIKESLVSRLKDAVEPISKAYDDFADKFKNTEVTEAAKTNLANDIASLSNELGLHKSPSSSANALVARVLKELPLQETAQDLRNYARNLKDSAPFGSDNYQIAKKISGLIRGAQDEAITAGVGAKAPEMLQSYQATQKAYSQMRDLLDTLNDRLRVGKYGGAESFMQNLKAMAPEDVVRRLSTRTDAELQQLLTDKFPEVSDAVKGHELNKILRASLDKSGEALDPKKLFKKIKDLQPEQRSYLINQEQQTKLDAIHGLLERVPTKLNNSGTAKTLDMLWNNMPASAAAIASMLSGHNPVAGFLLGKAASYIGKEVPDAARLAMLKFLGSEAPTNVTAFRQTVKLADNAIRGEKVLNKATKAIFEGASDLKEPSKADLEKLSKRVDMVTLHPDKLMDISGEVGHYVPDHAAGLSAASARAVQYLTSLKPSVTPSGILDKARIASNQEETDYNNALRIAENPMLILKSVKDGTINVKEIQHVNAMFPGLYAKMQSKVANQMMDEVSKNGNINYKTKQALSVFLGQPLSSSFKPQNIQSAQTALLGQTQQRQQQQSMAPKGGGKNALTKLPNSYLTPEQSRIQNKMGRH